MLNGKLSAHAVLLLSVPEHVECVFGRTGHGMLSKRRVMAVPVGSCSDCRIGVGNGMHNHFYYMHYPIVSARVTIGSYTQIRTAWTMPLRTSLETERHET